MTCQMQRLADSETTGSAFTYGNGSVPASCRFFLCSAPGEGNMWVVSEAQVTGAPRWHRCSLVQEHTCWPYCVYHTITAAAWPLLPLFTKLLPMGGVYTYRRLRNVSPAGPCKSTSQKYLLVLCCYSSGAIEQHTMHACTTC